MNHSFMIIGCIKIKYNFNHKYLVNMLNFIHTQLGNVSSKRSRIDDVLDSKSNANFIGI